MAISSRSGGTRLTCRFSVDMVKQIHAGVILSRNAQQMLFEDVHHRRHIEACGLLIGRIDEQGNWYIQQAHPLRNIFNSPVYFEFSPEDLLEADLTYPGQIVGAYHSHPTGFAEASGTDQQNMQRVNVEQDIPWIWLIICGPFPTLTSLQSEKSLGLSSILAYHHYAQEGLQRIPVEVKESES